jgi:GT2 family glycosyltransferase
MRLTSIITINFNQPEVTLEFLQSLKKHTGCNVEVILVDNGSLSDHSADFKKAFSNLICIRSETNLGFAGGNNLGILHAKGDYLLFLNNDTEITESLVSELIKVLDNDSAIGLVSPLIEYYHHPQIIQYAGYTEMNYTTCRNNEIGHFDLNIGQYDSVSCETSFCHGAAMMCRRDGLTIVGLMDENYFLYYEELDWCEKFKRAGKKMWFTGYTKILHKESVSAGRESAVKTYFMTRNRLLFIRKNAALINTFIFYLYCLFISCPKQVLVYLKKGRLDLIKWVIKGFFWNITHSKNSAHLGFIKP